MCAMQFPSPSASSPPIPLEYTVHIIVVFSGCEACILLYMSRHSEALTLISICVGGWMLWIFFIRNLCKIENKYKYYIELYFIYTYTHFLNAEFWASSTLRQSMGLVGRLQYGQLMKGQLAVPTQTQNKCICQWIVCLSAIGYFVAGQHHLDCKHGSFFPPYKTHFA